MKKLYSHQLRENYRRAFEEEWPDGMEITPENVRRAYFRFPFPLADALSHNDLLRYHQARQKVWAEFDTQTAAFLAARTEAERAAEAVYHAACEPYIEARKAAFVDVLTEALLSSVEEQ